MTRPNFPNFQDPHGPGEVEVFKTGLKLEILEVMGFLPQFGRNLSCTALYPSSSFPENAMACVWV
jgi:hypothetical protein